MSDPQKSDSKYQPRDPLFFAMASCVLATSLQPSGPHDDDRERAEKTAAKCAQMLDGGPAPEGLITPRQARILHAVGEAERLNAGLAGTTTPGASGYNPSANVQQMTEGARKAAREQLAKMGKLPERADVEKQNREHLARIRDVSEPVRFTALLASAHRLASNSSITGAHEHDACGVVAEELDRAIRVHEALSLPTFSAETDERAGREQGAGAMPYPASAVIVLLAAASASAEDGDDSPTQDAPGEEKPGS